ncbi:DUF6220 domain-containing protein [Chelativorans sp. AA-79]|uniref:DUF6220 domain-containing protein n=1 Tax=Chelativorans sp. AA-79 TaxID=3028735 RepID=UPI0023F715F1|nr:DUF6220 domain-containing protein [Chelativorans sp. AA-79]WEX07861.1 DUF6220 domain-containing protein [Chelativorans sp. AA-79]
MSLPQESPAGDRSHRIAPRHFAHAARLVPVLLFAQFFTAGLSLFQDAAFWEWHAVLGALAAVPILALFISTLIVRSVRPLRWWVGCLVLLYLLQIVYIVAGQNSGSGVLQAMHPFNGSLLLAAALVIVAKVERSHKG